MPDEKPPEDSVPPDDTTAATPLGVGKHMSRGGEDLSDRDPDSREEAQRDDGDGATGPRSEETGINP